jgi:hypothetical protein
MEADRFTLLIIQTEIGCDAADGRHRLVVSLNAGNAGEKYKRNTERKEWD